VNHQIIEMAAQDFRRPIGGQRLEFIAVARIRAYLGLNLIAEGSPGRFQVVEYHHLRDVVGRDPEYDPRPTLVQRRLQLDSTADQEVAETQFYVPHILEHTNTLFQEPENDENLAGEVGPIALLVFSFERVRPRVDVTELVW
jgi:hypothetical protein